MTYVTERTGARTLERMDHPPVFFGEDLMAQPTETMGKVFKWLGVSAHKTDPEKLMVRAHESDSHYRHKYLHRQHGKIAAPKAHEVPPRIQELTEHACGWHYEWFYPDWKKR